MGPFGALAVPRGTGAAPVLAMNAALPSSTERRYHELADPHHRSRWLADVVLGGQDGLVNVLGFVLGVAAATGSARIVFVAGLATALTESVSMGAVAYTSSVARGDLYKGERAREYRHIQSVPALEREEIRAIYSGKGFSGQVLDRIVDTITSNKDVWVAVMMAEEHHLSDTSRSASLRSAVVVGVSSLLGSLLPLAPFLVFRGVAGVWIAVMLSACVLFALGTYKARVTVGRPLKGGVELAAIGMLAAFLGYAVGILLRVPVVP
jgi:vacuolar iron transporter family protein